MAKDFYDNSNAAYHFPEELLEALVNVIPKINKSKIAVVDFFTTCGVPEVQVKAERQIVNTNRDSINKYTIARNILERINTNNENFLSARRKILQSVVEFTNFFACYENDRKDAELGVLKIQQMIRHKDTVARINIERQQVQTELAIRKKTEAEERQKFVTLLDDCNKSISALYSVNEPIVRGAKLEKALTQLFKAYRILIKEPFQRRNENGIISEQIDGAISCQSHLYLVEIKWYKDKIGVQEISHHMTRIFGRSDCRGLIISSNGFTQSSIDIVKEHLANKLVILVELQEILKCLEERMDLSEMIDFKTNQAILLKKPLVKWDKLH